MYKLFTAFASLDTREYLPVRAYMSRKANIQTLMLVSLLAGTTAHYM